MRYDIVCVNKNERNLPYLVSKIKILQIKDEQILYKSMLCLHFGKLIKKKIKKIFKIS